MSHTPNEYVRQLSKGTSGKNVVDRQLADIEERFGSEASSSDGRPTNPVENCLLNKSKSNTFCAEEELGSVSMRDSGFARNLKVAREDLNLLVNIKNMKTMHEKQKKTIAEPSSDNVSSIYTASILKAHGTGTKHNTISPKIRTASNNELKVSQHK